MTTTNDTITDLTNRKYAAGFVTDIDQELVPPGLNEDVVRLISSKKDEPEWMLEYRLKAFRYWQTLEERELARAEAEGRRRRPASIPYYVAKGVVGLFGFSKPPVPPGPEPSL